MSFDFSNELPENMHDVIKSAVDIVNDDFDYYKFMRAFSQNDPWNNPNGSLPTLSPQISRRDTTMDNDALKSCPSFRQPVFTFEETSSPPKQTRYGNGSSQKANSNSGGKIKRADTEIMGHNNNPQTQKEPILKLQITGNPNYQLDESDILGIFSRYGNVQRIELGKYRTAFIVFDNGMNALTAQKLLNGQYMKHLDIKLYLSWTNAIEDDLLRPEETLQPNRNISPRNEYPTFNNNGNVAKSLPNIGSSIPSFPYNSAKYTCKYEIQIDNDKDFKIARKIIGPKGCNMKKIIEICQYHLKRSDIIFQSDFLKLRLRGRGSGFKEGPEQKESNDPLHLCVSSKYPEVYHLACKLVEDLLTGLYKEYETVCQRAGRPLQEPVQIKRVEIYNGSNEKKPEVSSMNSIPSEYNSQSHPGSLVLNDNPDSSNSLGSLSDRECNNSPSRDNEAIVQLEESEAKSL